MVRRTSVDSSSVREAVNVRSTTLCGPDVVGKKMRQQPVEGLALRLHGAPLSRRDVGSDLAEAAQIEKPCKQQDRIPCEQPIDELPVPEQGTDPQQSSEQQYEKAIAERDAEAASRCSSLAAKNGSQWL